jgi:hypothetical protein
MSLKHVIVSKSGHQIDPGELYLDGGWGGEEVRLEVLKVTGKDYPKKL